MSEPYYVTAVEAELAARRRTATRIVGVVAAVVLAAIAAYHVLF